MRKRYLTKETSLCLRKPYRVSIGILAWRQRWRQEEIERRGLYERIRAEGNQLAQYLAKVDLLSSRTILFIPDKTKKGVVEVRYESSSAVKEIKNMYEQRWKKMIAAHCKKYGIENLMTIETQQE